MGPPAAALGPVRRLAAGFAFWKDAVRTTAFGATSFAVITGARCTAALPAGAFLWRRFVGTVPLNPVIVRSWSTRTRVKNRSTEVTRNRFIKQTATRHIGESGGMCQNLRTRRPEQPNKSILYVRRVVRQAKSLL